MAAVAGVGPSIPDAGTVVSVNYFNPVRLLEGLLPALAASGAGRAVVIGSNSSTTVPMIDDHLAGHLLAGDEKTARDHARAAQNQVPAEVRAASPTISAYATTKFALARWARHTAVTPAWARQGVLLNVVAPGAVVTPLMLAGGSAEDLDADSFPTPMPLGTFGNPEDIAFWVHQFLRPEARFTTGAILCVDGGTDAAMRPDAQPTAMTV
ncbi:SDR family oxidoreductase [Streptomyces pilosus]|uniref:SDR family oxidoreductase n=1 Tax=Streptomyces pilosus TaxID=28893 RepID=UPI001F29C946|nr:SDR family oxidoreductase [Streptomyces pilosus]